MYIKKVETKEELLEVYKLTHDVYVTEGYCLAQPDGLLKHYPHLDNIAETKVFITIENNKIIGTNSFTTDGPKKLHVDEDFPFETEEVRQWCQQHNQRLSASWRIVTKESNRKSLKVLLELINISMIEFLDTADMVLFTFNPKHEKFYKKMLGLKTIAIGTAKSVGGASAILMEGDSDVMANKWSVVCKKRGLIFPV